MKAEYITHMGDDLMVANVARTSFDKWKIKLDNSDEKLINYLAVHSHKSPFFHPQIQLRIHVPLFVANQIKKHQIGFAINEISRRYVSTTPEIYKPKEWRGRAIDKKQGSSNKIVDVWNTMVNVAFIDCVQIYNYLIEIGVAPEQARMILPQAMYTTFIWTGSLYAYANMYNLRIQKDAQKETQEIAKQIGDIMSNLFPISWVALTKDNKNAQMY